MSDGEAAARFQAIYERALARYQRRRAAADWFWYWCRKRWDRRPHATTKVRGRLVANVPELAHSPRRTSHVFYEDCLALEDEAEAFLNRLWRRQKGGGRFDISQSEPTSTQRHLEKGGRRATTLDSRFCSSRRGSSPGPQAGTPKDDNIVM